MSETSKPTSFIDAFRFFKWDLYSLIKYFSLPAKDRYQFFQKYYYNRASKSTDYTRDVKKERIVGSYEEHNKWPDHEKYIFALVDDSFKDKLGLDFGCGPGRNIVQFHKKFKRLDGVDISEVLIAKARENLAYHKVPVPTLYVNNGFDLADIPSDTYDLVMSTICMQHICMHSTRYNLMKEFLRVLKPGGHISIQMGYGKDSPDSVDYYADNANALTTNRGCDARVESPDQLKKDLEEIGFHKFSHDIRPTGPGDYHPNWIYFKAFKK